MKFTDVIESVTDAVPLVLFIALVFLGGIHTKAKAKASAEGKQETSPKAGEGK